MRLSRHLIATFVLLLCCVTATYAANRADEKYIFRQVNSKTGLSDNNIRDLLMLPNGVMMLYSPTMLSLYDGILYKNYPFNSTFIPYKEYLTDVEMVSTPDNKVVVLNGDRTWLFDINTLGYIYNDDKTFGLPLSSIKSIAVDVNDNYVIYTKEGKLYGYNRAHKTLSLIESPSALSGDVRMVQFGNYIYMLTRRGTLLRYDSSINAFTNLITNLTEEQDQEIKRLDVEVDAKGNIWVMYDHVIKCIGANSFTQLHRIASPSRIGGIYTNIAVDVKGRLWVGGNKQSLLIIDTDTGEFAEPNIEVIGNDQLDNNIDVTNIYTDLKGGIWIATESEGVLYFHEDIFRLRSVNDRVAREDTKCMVTTKDGSVLIGTSSGLYSYNPTSDEFSTPYKQLSSEDCISLYRDSRDRIWLGTFRHGAYCIDQGRVRNYRYPDMPEIEESYSTLTPNFNCVRSVCEDVNGDFWVSVYGGLARLDTTSGEITLLSRECPSISHIMFVRDIISVGDHIFVSSNNGYYSYNVKERELEEYPLNSNIYSRCNHAITDSQGVVWVATSMGVRVMQDGAEGQLITTQDGLVSNNIIALVEDHLSNIWAISPSSASRINILDRGAAGEDYSLSITSFTSSDGLDAGILFPKSVTTDTFGKVYIGGSHGFSVIDPSQLYQIKDNNPPLLTNLYINNTLINVGDEFNGRVVLEHGVSSTKEIVLNHNESFVTFAFSNLNYINPTHTLYRYKLENFDSEWKQINSKESARATYTLLKPGRYTFKVIATNNSTDWNKKGITLSIVVKPPFYQTTTAYIGYFILVILMMFYLLHLINKRNLERLMQREQVEKERVNQMKFRFFTNVSHELRTPLSLILLPLNNIIRKTPKDSEITPQLLTIERNASHLLSLVNHLLDFRKLEMGGEKLNLTKSNPVDLVAAIVSDFSTSAVERGIELKMVNSLENTIYYFDTSHISKVLNNLVSNALKFTPEGGNVTITLNTNSENSLVIEVCDSGVGISEDDQALIFDRFYQVKDQELHSTGSGIGLHLAKQYVELHKGELSVESQLGVGSTFRVCLPPLQPQEPEEEEEYIMDEVIDEKIAAESQAEEDLIEKFKVLIVEDNNDFRDYLALELKSLNYEVYTAVDGEDGIEKARLLHPSLVISDIMMPKSDGFTLCTTLKNDINTSHIPIILLTARTADDMRYEGYKAGADAYISKPFSFNVLEIRIRKLIEERQHRLEKIKSPQEIKTSQITVNSLDEKLMAQIIEHIEKNMSNAEYSVEQLSSDVAMHRMNLYRKIQSIAGMTPSEFLRTMRIKRAAQLMEQDSSLSILEISEMVGFNTPKYFTNYFRKIYGVTPSQYATDLKNKGVGEKK